WHLCFGPLCHAGVRWTVPASLSTTDRNLGCFVYTSVTGRWKSTSEYFVGRKEDVWKKTRVGPIRPVIRINGLWHLFLVAGRSSGFAGSSSSSPRFPFECIGN